MSESLCCTLTTDENSHSTKSPQGNFHWQTNLVKYTLTLSFTHLILGENDPPFDVVDKNVRKINTLLDAIQHSANAISMNLPDTTDLLQLVSYRREVEKTGDPSTLYPTGTDYADEIGVKLTAKLLDSSDARLRAPDFSSRLWSNCNFRKVFRTRNRRIGLGHGMLSKGDQVWLLAGSKVPFILRKHPDGRTTLIGEAYVDGMMYGELWSTDESELVGVTLS